MRRSSVSGIRLQYCEYDCKCELFSSILTPMDASAVPYGLALDPALVSLAALPPGTAGRVVGIGSQSAPLSALERRLLEFGFVSGESVEILAEARPGRDPFVVRVGNTTLALRRREAQNIWVELRRPEPAASPQAPVQVPLSPAAPA
jgi:ferrous iron transport protein A